MRTEPLTTEQANVVYDVLVEHCGASDVDRDHPYGSPRCDFEDHQTAGATDEYRFQGALGFGGKFWNCNSRWYVSAYPEDVKGRPERQRMIDAANATLAALYEKKEAV